MLLIFVAALLANFAFSYFFYTPKMWRLREEASSLVAEYELLQKKIALMSEELNLIRDRDRLVYRSIFSQDTIVAPTRQFDPVSVDYLGRYSSLVLNTEFELENLARKLYNASVSLDDMEAMSKNKDAMAERVPAIWPLDRRKMRGAMGAFGSRLHPVHRRILMHEGVDFGVPTGTPIVATGAGMVIGEQKRGYGIQILIDHGIGYKTRYAHLSKMIVRPGQYVVRGEIIGYSGSTGISTGPHLHYEVIHRGKPVNPISYFARDMSSDEFQEILANARQTTFERDE